MLAARQFDSSRRRTGFGGRFARSARAANGLRAYVLLETVLATGLLALGLAIIGGQLQDSVTASRTMELRMRALALVEMQLAHLDTGLIEFESVDDIHEGEFGGRFPEFAWRMTMDESAIEDIFQITLEILYEPFRVIEDEFDFDDSEVLYQFYVFRAAPRRLDLAVDFGVPEDQLEEIADILASVGVEGLDDPTNIDWRALGTTDFEELIEILPTLMSAFGMDLGDMAGQLPPEVLAALQEAGLLDGGGGEGDTGKGGGR